MMVSDLKQIMVVTKNELIKCVRGKKFLISLGIVGVVFILITLLQLVTGAWDSLNGIGIFIDTYFGNATLVIALVVALLSSTAIVSEFEERTALVLFTRPIKRTSIFVGKVLACVIIEAAIILGYYVLACLVGIIKIGALSPDIILSFLIAVLYAFAASGIAFIISSFFKKGSVCTIIALLVLVVILPIASAMVSSSGADSWYMMDEAGSSLYKCVPEYVEYRNSVTNEVAEVIRNATEILKAFSSDDLQPAITWIDGFVTSSDFSKLDTNTQNSMLYLQSCLHMGTSEYMYIMVQILESITESPMMAPMKNPDVFRSAIVLIVWGLVGLVISWIKFVRREF